MPSSVQTNIPLSVPNISGNEWRYVKECLDTGWVSSVGSFVSRFENDFAQITGSKYAVATASGTAALHVSLQLSEVSAGDEVVMPTLTFIAPANAVRYLGAFPTFIDAESKYWQIDTAKLADFFTLDCQKTANGLLNKKTGRKIAAILPVHVLGHPSDMDAIRTLSDEYNLPIIEDATESLGSKFRGKSTGTIGRVGCFSFNGNKIITCGGGGMITTDDETLARSAKYLTTQAKDNDVEFIHGTVGYNYRLTNLQAAVGCAQLESLPAYVVTKQKVHRQYNEAFLGTEGISVPQTAPEVFSNNWLYTIRVDSKKFGMTSRELMRHLHSRGIQSRPFWQPMHLSPAHKGSFATDCCTAEKLYDECLSLPCSTNLSPEEQSRVIEAIINK